MSETASRTTKTICVASGKGGVGKTSISVNLALALARQQYRVLLFDADVGLSNAQIALHCTLPEQSLLEARLGEAPLSELVMPTNFGIDLLPGSNGSIALAALSHEQSAKLVQDFEDLRGRYDYIVIDSAAGISPSVLTFLQASDLRLVVGTNEPASITDAYGLIKAMTLINVRDRILFVPNRVTPAEGRKLFERMEHIVQVFLHTGISFGGTISDDAYMSLCWKKSTPLMHAAPHSQIAHEVTQISELLLKTEPASDLSGAIRFFG